MKLLLFILIQVFANIIQAITGFAGGPLAMPPSMALVGVIPAKSSLSLIFLVSTGVVAFQNRRHINPKKLGTMLFFMAFGFLPGLWLFAHMEATMIMIIYGIVVTLIGIWKLWRPQVSGNGSRWGYLALILSGITQGMFTSGGPFAVIYASSAMKDKDEFRATLSAVWAILNLYMVIDMYFRGMYPPYNIKLGLVSILPVFAAIWIGNRINKKLDAAAFMKLVFILLIVSGILLIINALR
ncbi:MAG: sulfite exporter TauE/SafE family protein [Firmicutes bacterium]|jgi:hypothetical protein|nr:sulfite exporter TauE/SafE family protein [Bacillota bacterium]